MGDIPNELTIFHRFVSEQLAEGTFLTPEECLRAWRAEHPVENDLAESVAAVNRALAQADRGEGKPVDEFDRDFRARHGIGVRQ
jgi:hypothetical protein